MGWLDSMFGRKTPPAPTTSVPEFVPDPSEQAVVVAFDYGSTDLAPLFALEDELEAAVGAAGVGDLDGHEIATDGSDGFFYMYGPDADALFNVVRPILEATSSIHSAKVTVRYGPPAPGTPQRIVVVGS